MPPAADFLAAYFTRPKITELCPIGNGILLLCVRVQAEDTNVKKFSDRCAESQANWSALQGELGALEGTLKSVAAVRADMENMCAELKVLDEALDGHIQAKEERDMYKWKAGIEHNTTQFEAGRQADLAQMEKNLKAEKLRQEKLKKAEEDRILREIEVLVYS